MNFFDPDSNLSPDSFSDEQSQKKTGKVIHQFRNTFIPLSKKCVASCISLCRYKALPAAMTGYRAVSCELKKIHAKKSWIKRCGYTFFDNAVGLGIAMLTAKFVQSFFEVEGFSNLWGLFSSRHVVDETTYEYINFGVEFVITLVAFTLTGHLIEELRNRKNDEQHG